MRPDPQDLRNETDGRIIYLGDVRRRRTGRRRQQPDRHYLAALGLASVAAWAVWLTVVLTLQPARLISYVAFLLPLALALTATGSIVLYAVEWRLGQLPSLRAEVRRAALVAGVVVANLALLAAHRWSILVLGLSALLAIAAEGFATRTW
jgi:hypothetical protein